MKINYFNLWPAIPRISFIDKADEINFYREIKDFWSFVREMFAGLVITRGGGVGGGGGGWSKPDWNISFY